jgi:hypothetical protein
MAACGNAGIPGETSSGEPEVVTPDPTPVDSGVPDSTPDAGSPDAGATGCEGLVPGEPGEPRSFQTRFLDFDISCLAGTSDGWGNLALPMENDYQPHNTTVFLVSPSGTPQGMFEGVRLLPVEQREGFMGVENFGAWSQTDVVAFAASGQSFQRTNPQYGSGLAAVDPTGGLVAFASPEWRLAGGRLTAYDARATVRWSHTFSDEGAIAALGVDRQGNTLLLYSEVPGFGEGTLAGVWVDSSGHVSKPFLALTGLAGRVTQYLFTLSPQVGSGLFLQQTNYGAPPFGRPQWVRAFPSNAPRSEPAPDWLVSRPNTFLHMARGGRAYALLPAGGQESPDCSQSIEVLSASGTSCGSVRFQVGTSACTTRGLSVGYDGTVVQQLPSAFEPCNEGGHCSCTWRWWPAFLK